MDTSEPDRPWLGAAYASYLWRSAWYCAVTAHPEFSIEGYSFDARTGKQLALDEVLPIGAATVPVENMDACYVSDVLAPRRFWGHVPICSKSYAAFINQTQQQRIGSGCRPAPCDFHGVMGPNGRQTICTECSLRKNRTPPDAVLRSKETETATLPDAVTSAWNSHPSFADREQQRRAQTGKRSRG
jgi:hypothetical protein